MTRKIIHPTMEIFHVSDAIGRDVTTSQGAAQILTQNCHFTLIASIAISSIVDLLIQFAHQMSQLCVSLID